MHLTVARLLPGEGDTACLMTQAEHCNMLKVGSDTN